ncbi:MAG: NADPH:quinone reductase [Planctomycetota bacterium]|nr:MAG: NADPH:quinone reductase [Planctomycetota bacterium]
MKAAYYRTTGPASVIEYGNLPDLPLGAGQVRVGVRASAVNPIDLYIRSGTVAMPLNDPQIPGSDLAGVVMETGAGVKRLKVGDRVWGSNQGLKGRQGTACEFAVVDEEWLYLSPAGISDQQMAALALTGITAHLGLFHRGRLQAGESVYVSGGSGGVGTMVIQMAKAAGARVATTAGSAEKMAICRELGADLVMNYNTDEVLKGLKTFAPEGLDLWFETQREPDFVNALPLMALNGRLLVMAGRTAVPVFPHLGAFYPRNLSILGFAMFNFLAEDQRRAAEEITRWVSTRQLRAIVGHSLPLAQTSAAHQFLEEATLGQSRKLTGKVVLEI